MIFLWLKALHVVAVLAWIGGMLMLGLLLGAASTAPLPRLPQERRLMLVVRRWDRSVTTPAMLAAWGLGMAMAVQAGWFRSPWLMLKLVLVLLLSALHGVLAGTLRRMSSGSTRPPASWLRLAAGFTLLAAAAIALLVMLKPF